MRKPDLRARFVAAATTLQRENDPRKGRTLDRWWNQCREGIPTVAGVNDLAHDLHSHISEICVRHIFN